MTTQTQMNFIEGQLLTYGEVSRNQCLQNYISRLGARINDLKALGWEFMTEKRNGDYVYKLIRKPQVLQKYTVEKVSQLILV